MATKLSKTELMKYYYVQEKPIKEIAKLIGLGSDEAVRYHLRKVENDRKVYKDRDRTYTTADSHAMIQVFNDQADGENFDYDMAKIAILTQSAKSAVVKAVKPLWEQRYGKAYPEQIMKEIEESSDVPAVSEVNANGNLSPRLWLISDSAKTPRYSLRPGGGLSLHASEQVFLRPGDAKMVATGVAIDVPKGYVAMLVSDPQLMESNDIGVAGSPLVIAPGDNDEIRVKVMHYGHGSSSAMFTITPGQKIAQIVFVASPLIVWQTQS